MIEFRNVRKTFGRGQDITALNKISFSIAPGEVIGILGPNGSGKTTMINLLLGLLKPSEGEVLLDGNEVWENREMLYRNIGALLEAPRLYPEMTTRQNLESFCLLAPDDIVIPDGRIDELIELVELGHAADQPFNTFSLGMRQRLAIAVALLYDPPILIFDEPTNGLDPEGIIEIRRLIQKLAKTGKTILLCSHLISEVQEICAKVLILRKGHMLHPELVLVEDIKNSGHTFLLSAADSAALKKALDGSEMKLLRTEQTPAGEMLHVAPPLNMNGEAINRWAFDKGITLSTVHKRLNTLEDFFLDSLKEPGDPAEIKEG